eukprot:scaffold48862_cov71-Attheya_sp.AAC.1
MEKDDFPVIPEQRENDSYLMEIFAQYTTDRKRLRPLNRCRLHLQAYTLADVSTGDGLQISKAAFQLTGEHPKSNLLWPPQQLTAADKGHWQTAISDIFGEHRRLHTPLGKWCHKPHQQHTWFYHVDAYRQPAKPPKPTTLRATLQSWEHTWMFDHIIITGSEVDLVTAIRDGTAVVVCDGSYMPKADKKRGSTCLIIECQLTKAKLVLVCQSPGTYANAYRSEMMGLYVGMCITHAFCLAYNITAGAMSISCDNDSALWKTAMEVPKVNYKKKSSDLLRGIHYLKHLIPIKWTFTQVLGHADDDIAYEDLDRISQLNVQCDTEAKQFLRACIDQNAIQPYHLPFQGWRCQIDNVWMSDEVGTAVRDIVG